MPSKRIGPNGKSKPIESFNVRRRVHALVGFFEGKLCGEFTVPIIVRAELDDRASDPKGIDAHFAGVGIGGGHIIVKSIALGKCHFVAVGRCARAIVIKELIVVAPISADAGSINAVAAALTVVLEKD